MTYHFVWNPRGWVLSILLVLSSPLDRQLSPRAGTADVEQTAYVSCDDLVRIPTKCDRGMRRQNKPTTRPVSGSSPTSQNPEKPLVSYRKLS